MSATPALSTADSEGLIGRVSIANAYAVAGTTLAVTPTAQIAVDGLDPAFQQPTSGTVEANQFPGRVVAIGPRPGDYTGSPNVLADEQLCRVHGAGVLMQMPASPWDGTRVVVVDADGTADTLTPQVQPNTAQSLQDPYNLNNTLSSAIKMRIPYQSVEWAWDGVAGIWRIVADNCSGVLPVITINANTTLTGRAYCRVVSASGAFTVTLPSDPTEGMVVAVKDISANAGVNNITIAASGAYTIQPTGTSGAVPAASTTIAANRVGAEWVADTVSKVWWARCTV